jgi:hypothetical protein
MKVLSHADLVEAGARWLFNKGFKVVLKELSTCSLEIPDCLGFNSGHSFLLEAKATRSDFLSDKKKHFRRSPWQGMGLRRSYICPKYLIKPEELPENWGLIYVNENGKARQIKKAQPFKERHLINEQCLLVSVVRRMIDGFEYKKYLHRSE